MCLYVLSGGIVSASFLWQNAAANLTFILIWQKKMQDFLLLNKKSIHFYDHYICIYTMK